MQFFAAAAPRIEKGLAAAGRGSSRTRPASFLEKGIRKFAKTSR